MRLVPGTIIKSTEALDDTYFESAVIIITESNDNGSVGFITNRLFSRRLDELHEFKDTSFPLFEGGPVDYEHLYFIHRTPNLINGGTPLGNKFYFGGDFLKALSLIRENSLSINDIKIFIGYCGWDVGELEAEIEEGSWELETEIVAVF